jgi:hypothetical protein
MELGRAKKSSSVEKLLVNGQPTTDPVSIANVFSSHFDNISKTIMSNQGLLQSQVKQSENKFDPLHVSPFEVLKVINSLNPSKATGLDGISIKTLQCIGHALASPLADIFNASLLQGHFPTAMKAGKLISIHKKGSVLDVGNYRPVTILPSISKVFERLMHKRLYDFILPSLTSSQFGFIRRRSTQDAILHFISSIYDDLEKGRVPVGVCYDLSKAFDSINHNLLLDKLQAYGITGRLHDWFRSYLTDRPTTFTQRLPNGQDITCEPIMNNIGVPQGSILGPLLFLIYINDVVDCFPDDVLATLFADDSNAKFSVSRGDVIEPKLTGINDDFQRWASRNGLTVNSDKTATLVFRKGVEKSELQCHPQISVELEVKFLGILVDDELRFHSHVESVCKRLSSAVFCLKSVRDWAGIPLLLSLYHGLFQSHLSYGILVWGNLPEYLSDRIVRLQKYAIRTMLRKHRRHSCRQLFSELGILTFPCLYILNAVTYAHSQLLSGKFQANGTVTGYNTRTSSDIFRHSIRLEKVQGSISHHAAFLFNSLPPSLKEVKSQSIFLCLTKSFLLKNPFYKTKELVTNC